MVKWLRETAKDLPPFEPSGRNARPGAPVTGANEWQHYAATRVEPWNVTYIPPLISSGVGCFFLPPNQKGGKYYERRKSVHV